MGTAIKRRRFKTNKNKKKARRIHLILPSLLRSPQHLQML